MDLILDWTGSVIRDIGGDRSPYINPDYRDYYTDEVIAKRASSVRDDFYTLAWSMVFLLGGEPETKEIPAVEPEILGLLNHCLQPDRARRPGNVETVYLEFRDICKRLWGFRKFTELKI